MTGPDSIRIFGLERRLRDREDWDPEDMSPLWRYHLHYFDDLMADGGGEHSGWTRRLVSRWIEDNPDPAGIGWDAYPCSRRASNWIKTRLAGRPAVPGEDANLAGQIRFLEKNLEFHLLGNHLFANAKALILAGVHFAGSEGDRWLRRGLQILEAELAEQVLPDGGHFERSPMYHSIVLEDLLDCLNALRASGTASAIVPRLVAASSPMLSFLEGIVHPDGDIPHFNDCAFGVAPSPASLRRYAADLGIPLPPPPAGSRLYPLTGLAARSIGPAFFIADVGDIGPDFLPGHAHCDTLSFELSLDGRRLVTNSGTYSYQGADRGRFRGTAAHNTLQLDGAEQHEIWASFRVGRRGKAFDVGVEDADGRFTATGAHDGYARLAGFPIHRRRWILSEEGLSVADQVEGRGTHSAVSRIHLAPEARLESSKDCEARFRFGDRLIRITPAGPGSRLRVLTSRYSKTFYSSVERPLVELEKAGDGPVSLGFRIGWGGP